MKGRKTALPGFGWKGILAAAGVYMMYTLVLPLLSDALTLWLESRRGVKVPAGAAMLLPYYASFLLTAFVFKSFLTDALEPFFSRLFRSVGSVLAGMAVYIALTMAVGWVLGMLEGDAGVSNPNDSLIETVYDSYRAEVIVMAVLLGPLVEEVIFRGAVFGSLWNRNRAAAYIISWLLFALAHVATYTETYTGWNLPIYLAQYLPFSLAAAWCYQKSGSIWAPVFMHMTANLLSFL